MTTEYSLKVLRAEGLRFNRRLHSKVPDPYVVVRLGDASQKTKPIEENTSPTWNELLAFSSKDDSAAFEIAIKHKSSWSSDPCIGIARIRISDLLRSCADGETSLALSSGSATMAMTTGTLFLRLEVSDSIANVEQSLITAAEDVQERGFVRSANSADVSQSINNGVTQLARQGELYHAIGELLSRLETLRGVMDTVSEIHPFMIVAWSLVSGLYKAIDRTFQTDKKLVHLVRSLESAFAFVRERQSLKDKVASLQQSIEGLLKQTAECCTFVRQYTRSNFLRRMLDVSASQKIEDFKRALDGFKKEIESGTVFHTALVSSRVQERVDDIACRQRQSSLQERLNPASFDAFDRPTCLPGTRTEVLHHIVEWVFSDTEQNILWLHGVAGSGKSTVSTTIANDLKEMSRLGAFLFFERGKSEPSSVIRTIAYKLALYDPSIGSSILSALDNDKDIGTSSALHQFTQLLLRPLSAVAESMSGPLVVVLDAFDECGTPDSRRSLIDLFKREFPKLPRVFRFLITSRRELDIDVLFSSRLEIVRALELDNTTADSLHDVNIYIRKEMDSIFKDKNVAVPRDWPWDEKLNSLGKAANGLFIWASTAVKTVRSSNDPFNLLDQLVEDSQSLSEFGLDDLYATVLSSSGIAWNDKRSRDRFEKVLALVLCSKAPLSIEVIDGILGWKEHETSRFVLSGLRTFVSYTAGGTVALFHTSFSDYLMSPERSKGPWSIDIPKVKTFIVERCFAIMKDLLQFNICSLESSFVRNDDVPGLTYRIEERIPSHLEYACRYWAQHLSDIPESLAMLSYMSDFAHHRLLFWFEVLSLVKAFYRFASRALLDAANWAEYISVDIAAFLRDASSLASTYAPAISRSTPHIYVSMIPLGMHDSLVARYYSEHGAVVAGIERRGVKKPPMHLRVLDGHYDAVYAVAFSPCGKRVASGSRDRSIRVWDLDSGEEICIPLAGHSKSVTSICFSPDGKRIVSGSLDRTIRVWDAETGELILGPLNGHKKGVRCVVFSPDGTRIASGSTDKTIVVWDAKKGEPIVGPFTGHTGRVNSVAFSLDGARLVSGSDDQTVIIWNVQDGEPAHEPLKGHSDWVWSVAFSPNDRYVVSGSCDNAIVIWEVESRNPIITFSGHSSPVTSVAYSPCGTRIASASADNTIIVWNAETGQITSGPLKGHSNTVRSVAWSPDGKYFASGSLDKTVRIWSASARVDESYEFSGHADVITSVAISPDGGRIASASLDKSIIVWNAENGEVVLGPLQGHSNDINCVLFTLDGSRVISGSDDKTIRVWDVDTGVLIFDPLKGHTSGVWCIAMTPDGSKLASGSYDNTIRVWELKTGALVAGPLRGHWDSVYSVAFSPNGNLLASGSADKRIRIWDTETWKCISEPLTEHSDEINSVCFSPDGTRLASGSHDKTIIIWDVENMELIDKLWKRCTNYVLSVIFSLDGTQVISNFAEGEIRIWNLESVLNAYKILEGHTDAIRSLALASNGSRLVSGSYDNTIRMWDVSDINHRRNEGDGNVADVSREDLSAWVLGDGGWILPGHGRHELLLWIPPDLRPTLWRPRNTAVFSCGFSTRLDLSGAALGEQWTEVFTRRQVE